MGLLETNINNWGWEDIEYLREAEISESKRIEYKSTLRNRDEHIEKLLKSVVGFANSEGGYIIYGIETNHPKEPEIPVDISGFTPGDNLEGKLVKWIEDLIVSNVTPRISPKIDTIKNPNTGNLIGLVQVSASPNSPHMITRENFRGFYERENFQTIPMQFNRIQSLMIQRESTDKEIQEQIDNLDDYLFPEPDVYLGMLSIPIQTHRKLANTRNNELTDVILDQLRIMPNGHQWKLGAKGFEVESNRPEICAVIQENGVIGSSLNVEKSFDRKETISGNEVVVINSQTFLLIEDFLHLAGFFYKTIDYFGPVELVLKLPESKHPSFIPYSNRHLDVLEESYKKTIKTDVDNLISKTDVIYEELMDYLYQAHGYVQWMKDPNSPRIKTLSKILPNEL